MIPQIGLGTTLDTGKQLASIRSYLIQLRDAVDDDIHAIGFDNLTADLRKRIEGLENNISNNAQFAQLVAERVKADYVTAKTLVAEIAKLDEVYASRAWITALDAEVARIRDVEVATLKAKAITTDNLSAQSISAGQITTGSMSVSRLKSANNTIQTATWQSLQIVTSLGRSGSNLKYSFKTVYVLCGSTLVDGSVEI